MAMKRICDICGAAIETVGYQYPPPSVLTDNVGKEAVDSSMTDVCPECVAARAKNIIAVLLTKAVGK